MPKIIDLTGKRFYNLTVLKETDRGTKRDRLWECVCDCGKTCVVLGNNLKSGHTKSCGCLSRALSGQRLRTHGKRHTRLYKIWCGMKDRCYNEKTQNYYRYGGRGITVCEEWRNSFTAFYEWAIANGYEDNLTIERNNVDGNYEPSNCRWATMKEQQNNRRNNRHITYNGETHTMAQWAEIKGIGKAVLYKRLYDGWSIERALTTPARKLKRKGL